MRNYNENIDDAAVTRSFARIDVADETAVTDRYTRLDADATSIYDISDIDTAPVRAIGRSRRAASRRRLIRDTRQVIEGLRDALASGWDVGPELAHEERRLVELEASS